eukprot:7180-Karenia_brevis.AAC.1
MFGSAVARQSLFGRKGWPRRAVGAHMRADERTSIIGIYNFVSNVGLMHNKSRNQFLPLHGELGHQANPA